MKQKGSTVRAARRSPRAGVEQGPTPVAVAALAALGVLSALWALFLWQQLVLAHSGEAPFCAAGEAAGCAASWDSAFASAIHRFTGLPLAGWGLVWGVAAFAFPFLSLLRLAQRKSASDLTWAARWVAAAGVAGVIALVIDSFTERVFCWACSVIYLSVTAYSGVTLVHWQRMSLRESLRGLALAAGASGILFLLLLYPGLETRGSSTTEGGKKMFAEHARSGTGDPIRDLEVARLVAALAPNDKQILSDSLYIYRSSPKLALPPPRGIQGPSERAPVRITEFSDVLCIRCARLQATLESLRDRFPPESLSIEPRHFPLDTGCNPRSRARHGRSARCLAALAQICLEGREKAFEFSSALFENQAALNEEKVYALAAPYRSRPDLERCIGSPETRAKLAEDLALAYRHQAGGVPLVLVNGRRGTSFGPFLDAMVLTRGEAFHPAFDALPEPNSRVDMH